METKLLFSSQPVYSFSGKTKEPKGLTDVPGPGNYKKINKHITIFYVTVEDAISNTTLSPSPQWITQKVFLNKIFYMKMHLEF